MTAECLACDAGVSVQEYCSTHPSTTGCSEGGLNQDDTSNVGDTPAPTPVPTPETTPAPTPVPTPAPVCSDAERGGAIALYVLTALLLGYLIFRWLKLRKRAADASSTRNRAAKTNNYNQAVFQANPFFLKFKFKFKFQILNSGLDICLFRYDERRPAAAHDAHGYRSGCVPAAPGQSGVRHRPAAARSVLEAAAQVLAQASHRRARPVSLRRRLAHVRLQPRRCHLHCAATDRDQQGRALRVHLPEKQRLRQAARPLQRVALPIHQPRQRQRGARGRTRHGALAARRQQPARRAPCAAWSRRISGAHAHQQEKASHAQALCGQHLLTRAQPHGAARLPAHAAQHVRRLSATHAAGVPPAASAASRLPHSRPADVHALEACRRHRRVRCRQLLPHLPHARPRRRQNRAVGRADQGAGERIDGIHAARWRCARHLPALRGLPRAAEPRDRFEHWHWLTQASERLLQALNLRFPDAMQGCSPGCAGELFVPLALRQKHPSGRRRLTPRLSRLQATRDGLLCVMWCSMCENKMYGVYLL